MMQRSQVKQSRQTNKLKQLRYRKLTLAGGNTIVTYHSNSKVKQKANMIEFPVLENQQNTQGLPIPPFDLKAYEQELYKKNNYRAMKALLKAYDEGKKKNNNDTMNVLGLDIRKLHCVPQQSKPALHKKSSTKVTKTPFKLRNMSPSHRVNASSRSEIVRKKSQQSYELDGDSLKGLKNTSLIFIGEDGILRNTNNKLESVQSAYFSATSRNEIDYPVSAYSTNSPNSKFKAKKQKYLYERLAGKQMQGREQINLVYERRIRSYVDLLFKLQMAHNIYINLDLKTEDISVKGRRVKYFVGPGNNSAMIKGLMKRRYWWQPSEDIKECCFVWTQIKINTIFEKQHPSKIELENQYLSIEKQKISEEKQKIYHKTDSFKKPKLRKNETPLIERQFSPTKRQQMKEHKKQEYNNKILNEQDVQTYEAYYDRYQKNSDKHRTFAFKTDKINKVLTPLPQQDAMIHNHLPHNYHLGNKKALFYNIKLYYTLIGEDPFQYIPLTFHIKNGFKDEEYKRFVAHYNKRKNMIKREIKEIEEEYGEGYQGKKKTRNIWIVKPGQNSNQGRGITVIDQIYELNAIMKRTETKKQSCPKEQMCGNISKEEQDEKGSKRTHIVQMYIDRPFLYQNRKFDIRHYMLITNMFGVRRVYWYSDGYIRTSSYQFRVDIFEPQIHLTNDFVQKKYPEYGKYELCNKISYQEFQRYLDSYYSNKKYSFKNDILPKMKKIATDAAKSVCLKLSPNNLQHTFEIFGLDFMIDRHFKPWLIEINTNPCLQCNCPLLDRIIPYMVEQSFKLSIDIAYPPPSQYPNTCKHFAPFINLQAFKYELIFDERTDGDEIKKLYGVYKDKSKIQSAANRKLLHKLKLEQAELGELEDDEWFGDDGKQMKLDDFT